jgi:serine/threonine-protein kinase
MDLLTDALAMVGQHGIYCQSTRVPGRPALDIALVVEQIGDAEGAGPERDRAGQACGRMNEPTAVGAVAHYTLLERLEPAGPGDLYRARDTRHGRTVIVRLLAPASQSEEQRLLRQAQSLAGLSHQNVIHVYQSGVHDGRVFVAFEHVKGQSLRAEMAGRQMNARRAVELAIGIADAVAEANALGFLHGGISPDAIGITAKGHSKIAAFHLGTTLGFAVVKTSHGSSTTSRRRKRAASRPTNDPMSTRLAPYCTRC